MTVNVPSAVGVPLMTPVPESKLAHAGSPLTERVTGAVPLADKEYENGWATTPAAVAAEVMAGRARTVTTSVFESEPTPLLAPSEMETTPSTVGVPESTPALNDAQAGRLVAESVTGAVPLEVSV